MTDSSQSSPRVASLGEVLWDCLPEGRRLGGAPANFAFHAQAQGMSAILVSGVGIDALGAEIIAQLEARETDTRFLFVLPDYPTGSVSVQIDAEGIPEYSIKSEVAWDHLPWQDDLTALAASVQAVCFGTLGQRSAESRATIRRFLMATGPTCLRVCDINLRAPFFNEIILRESLGLATVLKLNQDELPIVARSLGLDGDADEMLSGIRELCGLELIALTRGAAGSVLLTAERRSEHPGFPVAVVVDTVGAGDAFTATLVAGLLRGDDLDTLHAAANRVAADVCSHAGASFRPKEEPA